MQTIMECAENGFKEEECACKEDESELRMTTKKRVRKMNASVYQLYNVYNCDASRENRYQRIEYDRTQMEGSST
eukprot:m.215086 g.215086  ORF g.215086 m.215086 type:complete len:74 (-) comp33183_c0_seq1:2446-2667(-)